MIRAPAICGFKTLAFSLSSAIFFLLLLRTNRFSDLSSYESFRSMEWNFLRRSANITSDPSVVITQETILVSLPTSTSSTPTSTSTTTSATTSVLSSSSSRTTLPPAAISPSIATKPSSAATSPSRAAPSSSSSSLTPSAPPIAAAAEPPIGWRRYMTSGFYAVCAGGGLSNRIFEFVSLYGIARTLGRTPYANMSDCMIGQLREMTSYFPQIALAIELKFVPVELTTMVPFSGGLCCVYDDVTRLANFTAARFITLTNARYMQSFKYFDRYKPDVLKLLAFTEGDLAATALRVAELFGNDTNHKICVHTRRGDFIPNSLHQPSTENFTRAATLYVRDKLTRSGVNTTVVISGYDRAWIATLFPNASWVLLPKPVDRVTIDYILFARYCETILLTASASTFGFWSAYLSSAETIYYNQRFSKNENLKRELKPEDFFPPGWKSLTHNETTDSIYE